MVHYPSVFDAERISRRIIARLRKGDRLFHKRLEALFQIGGKSRPVIHLIVDVCRIFGIPCRIAEFIPESLQVQRLGIPGSADHQVSAILEKDLHQVRILVFTELLDPGPHGYLILSAVSSKLQVHPVKKLRIIRLKSFVQFLISLLRSSLDILRCERFLIRCHSLVIYKVCTDRSKKHYGIRVCHSHICPVR